MSDIRAEAEAEIARQLFEYALASDTHDWNRLGALFARGRYHFCEEDGAAAVRQWGETVINPEARTQHAISTLTVEVDDQAQPPTAQGRNYLSLYAVDPSDGETHLVSACWFDSTWELHDGRWWWRTHQINPLFRGNWRLLHRTQQFAQHPGSVS